MLGLSPSVSSSSRARPGYYVCALGVRGEGHNIPGDLKTGSAPRGHGDAFHDQAFCRPEPPAADYHQSGVQFLGELGDLLGGAAFSQVCPCHGSPAILKRSACSSRSSPAPRFHCSYAWEYSSIAMAGRAGGRRSYQAWTRCSSAPVRPARSMADRVARSTSSEASVAVRILDGKSSAL